MADNKKVSVFGIFNTMAAADFATDSCIRGGFAAADISALIPENLGSRQIATAKASKAPEGAAAGAGSGAVLGGALGLLVGMGALAIPGAGPFLAAGPLMATLAGIGVGGTVGGFAGALIGLGIPEYEAKRYAGHIQKGAILLSVHCANSDEIRRAKEILRMSGGEDISSTGEASAARTSASGSAA
jgi:hypothetical protein